METQSPSQLVTASQVEAFLVAKIIEVQNVIPEFCSVGCEIVRHICTTPTDARLEWKLYTESSGNTSHTSFDSLMVTVSKHRDIRATKLREQAAALIKQAEEIEAGKNTTA